jgi:hypothetical protein
MLGACTVVTDRSPAGPEPGDHGNDGEELCDAPANSVEDHYTGDLLGIDLGAGINSLTMSIQGRCIRPAPSEATCGPSAARSFSMVLARDADELREALGASADASNGSGMSSGNAETSFFRSHARVRASVYLLLDVVIAYDSPALGAVELNDDALQTLGRDPVLFTLRCGDEYVSQISRGGRFRALYEFSSVTEQRRVELASSFRAGGADWSRDESFLRTLEEARSRNQTYLYVSQQGGAFEATELDPAGLIAAAKSFGAAANASTQAATCTTAYPLAAHTRSYYTADNFPLHARYPDVTAQRRELDRFARDWSAAETSLADVDDYLLRGQFDSDLCKATGQRLRDARSALASFEHRGRAKIEACRELVSCGVPLACMTQLERPPVIHPPLTPREIEDCGLGAAPSSNAGLESSMKWLTVDGAR